MNLRTVSLLRVAALALAVPTFGNCAALLFSNTSCLAGNCASPTPVIYGSTESDSYTSSTIVNYNNDYFRISATWSDGTDQSGGTFVNFSPAVQYVGNINGSGPSINQADVITLDLLASIAYGAPVDWSGVYTENFRFNIAPGDSALGQILVATTSSKQSVGLVTAGPGMSDLSQSNNMSGLTGPTLNYDAQDIFYFYAGTPFDASSSDPPPAPEPAQIIPTALGLICFVGLEIRRRKQAL